MATYKEIKDYIRDKDGVAVKTCWIADRKEANGIPIEPAPNRSDPAERKNPCPPDKAQCIYDALKRFGMI